MSINQKRKGHREAIKLLNKHFITEIDEIDLEGIANVEGAFIDYKKMKGSEGRIVINENKAIISINKHIKNEGKRRFVLAHELGHFIMHRGIKEQFYNCTTQDFLDWNNKRKEETEANDFASEILMPSYLFQKECSGKRFSFDILKDLSKKFNVSLTAVSIKFVEYGNYPCALIFIQNGIIKWSKVSEDFPIKFIRPNQTIPFNTVARDIYDGESVPNTPELVDAISWFKEDFSIDKYQNWRFKEQCMYFKKYKTIISFLWSW